MEALLAEQDPNKSDTPPDDVEDEARRLRLTPLSRIRLRATHWLWADRAPIGALTLWAGREGIGKSTSAAWLAAQVTRGALPGTYFGVPRSVFYAASEDSWERTVAPRLVAAGADLDRTFRIDVIEDEATTVPLTLPSDIRALGKALKEHDAALLIIDPLVSTLNGKIDTHRDREVRSALEPLGRIADDAGAAVVGLVHFGKGSSTDPLSLILGSRAFSATARAVVAMAKDPDNEDGTVVLSQEKNNLGRLDLPSLTYVVDSVDIDTDDGLSTVGVARFTGETDRSVSDMLADGAVSTSGDRSERAEAAEWLADYLIGSGGEASAMDVFKAGDQVGYSKDSLKRAKKQAGVASQKSDFGTGWVWRLVTTAPAEGSTKSAKGAALRELHPSLPSTDPPLPWASETSP